jgi:hypothetical protein
MSKIQPVRQRTDAPRQDEGRAPARRCWPVPYWDWPPTPWRSPSPGNCPARC